MNKHFKSVKNSNYLLINRVLPFGQKLNKLHILEYFEEIEYSLDINSSRLSFIVLNREETNLGINHRIGVFVDDSSSAFELKNSYPEEILNLARVTQLDGAYFSESNAFRNYYVIENSKLVFFLKEPESDYDIDERWDSICRSLNLEEKQISKIELGEFNAKNSSIVQNLDLKSLDFLWEHEQFRLNKKSVTRFNFKAVVALCLFFFLNMFVFKGFISYKKNHLSSSIELNKEFHNKDIELHSLEKKLQSKIEKFQKREELQNKNLRWTPALKLIQSTLGSNFELLSLKSNTKNRTVSLKIKTKSEIEDGIDLLQNHEIFESFVIKEKTWNDKGFTILNLEGVIK